MIWMLAYAAIRLTQGMLSPWCAEDAYITFRAARNWLWYGAPTFNPGEPSWPASSPLWTAWMYAGHVLGLEQQAEAWSRLGSCTAEVALILAVSRLVNRRAAILFGAMLLLGQCQTAIALSGIEMYAMIAAFAWALLGNRAAFALLVISRPEGIALALLAGSIHWRKAWLPALAGLAGWVGFGLLCHQWLPAGVGAKVGTYGLHLGAGGYWAAHLCWPFSASSLEQRSMGWSGLFGLVAIPWVRLRKPAVLFLVAAAGQIAAYWLAGSVYFFWYMALPLAAASLMVASIPARRVAIAATALVILAGWCWTTYPWKRWAVQYHNLGSVSSVLPDSGTVVMDAIGIAGWLHPATRFVDVIGLSSPRAAAIRRAGMDGWLTDMVRVERPLMFVAQSREVAANEPASGTGSPFRPGHSFGEAIYLKDMLAVVGYRLKAKVGSALIFQRIRLDAARHFSAQ